jgi:cytochrome P450
MPFPISYDPYAPGFFQNPYPQLCELMEQAPVHFTEQGIALILRYDEGQEYLAAHDTSVMMKSILNAPPETELWQPAEQSAINQDPPNHNRLRRLMMQAFTSRAIAALNPMIRETYYKLMVGFERDNGGDFVEKIAFTMPYHVICNMLGVPTEEGLEIRDDCLAITKAIVDLEHSPDTLADARKCYDRMVRYFDRLVAAKRQKLADDILSGLIRAEENGSRLSHQELIDTLALIYIGGFDSVISALGSGLMLLLQNPDQLQLWRDNPFIDQTAFDEIVRIESPVLFGGRRITTRDMDVGGICLPKGTLALVCAGSANRDPRFWGDSADKLRLDRRDAARALSFGGGIHRCLGNVLARNQVNVVLGSIIREYRNLRMVSEVPVWKRGTHQRSLASLNISLGL